MPIWKKYNCTSTTTYTEVIKTDGQGAGMTQTNPYTIASTNQYGTYLSMRWATSYTFDSETGKFTLKNYKEGTYLEAYYAGVLNSGSSTYYVQGSTSGSGTIDTNYVFRVFNGEYAGSLYFKNRHSSTKTTTYSRGAYIIDIQASSSSAYPTNGRHSDGYWYELQSYTEVGGSGGDSGAAHKLYMSKNPIETRKLPAGYTELEYIGSTGTQLINTGVKPNQDTRVIVDFEIDPSITAESHIASVRSSSGGSPFFTLYYSGSAWGTRYGTQALKTSTTITSKVRHLFDKNKNTTTIDSTEKISANYETFSSSTELPLFCRADGTTYNGHIKGKIYSCLIYDNGNLIRDYVPCKNSSGTLGLYDLVNGQFYTNEGTGTFTCGPAKASLLPAEYTRLSYIESTGTQYINTGFKPNNNTRVVMDFENSGDYSAMTTSLCPLLGARNGSSSAVFALWIGTKTYPQYGNVAYNKNGNFTVNLNSRLIYDFNKNIAKIGESSITCTTATFSTNYNLYLLAMNNYGTIDSRHPSGKLYSSKIYDNDTIVRDFVPCKNASGVAGLYDLVNGQFYTNEGTGVFGCGTEIILRDLPLGYTQLTYIVSTGTQYINTGFIANQDTRVVMEAEHSVTSAVSWLFGARTATGKNSFTFLAYQNKYRTDYNTSILYYEDTITDMVRIDKNKTVTTLNDTAVITDTSATFSCQYPLYLLAMNTAGTASGFASVKLKSVQIYDNGTLIRDYVPCMSVNRTVGLYDLINQEFVSSSGSGEFIAGDSYGEEYKLVERLYVSMQQYEPRTLPSEYTQVEYIQSSGTQYIDTGFKPNQDTRVVMDFELLAVVGQYADPIFGVRTSASSKAYYLWVSGYAVTTEQYQSGYNNGSTYPQVTRVGRHKVDKNKNATTVDGVSVSSTYTSFTTDWNMLLFNSYNNGSIYGSTTKMKLYSCQIYDNDTLIRDFVPCKNSSGTVGLYDLVNSKFYTNAGTGTFTAGSTHPHVYKKIKKLYADVNGYYRQIFGISGDIQYRGRGLASLTSSISNIHTGSNKDYAFCFGGTRAWNNSSSAVSTVHAINEDLTVSTAPSLQLASFDIAAGSMEEYAIVADYYRDKLYSYSTTLTRSLIKDVRTDMNCYIVNSSQGNNTKDYLVIPTQIDTTPDTWGDAYKSNYFMTIDKDLTIATVSVGIDTSSFQGADFGGDIIYQSDNAYAIYMLDNNMTLTLLQAFLRTKDGTKRTCAKAAAGDYMLFGGGTVRVYDDEIGDYDETTHYVDVMDKNETMSYLPNLNSTNSGWTPLGASFKGYGIFAFGQSNRNVTVYNSELTKVIDTTSDYSRYSTYPVSVGDHLLFPGGYGMYQNQASSQHYNSIEVFSIK